ncbi:MULTISPECIES: hypothetical protein [Halobacteriales]|uniref:DUF1269 domain-containing protein n=1 Tax=Halobaculum roseum TaxID=2175149 RepID=A0ABD5MJV7_9EURY|nr:MULTISPECIES: hypothetical protein [Halobacteria]QZY04845.1 hypothetical protein K6T36_18225 [Halobaculum roseum]
MRRIVATFDDSEETTEAKQALREAGLEPDEPDIDNPFFDPATKMPERRGLLWGGLLGGLIGAVLLFMMDQNMFWIPRISPIMTAGQYMLILLGFGLGAAIGGFLGGVVGTSRQVTALDQPRVAVMVPDNRVGETEDLLRDQGATAVDGTVTHHEHPQQTQAKSSTSTD